MRLFLVASFNGTFENNLLQDSRQSEHSVRGRVTKPLGIWNAELSCGGDHSQFGAQSPDSPQVPPAEQYISYRISYYPDLNSIRLQMSRLPLKVLKIPRKVSGSIFPQSEPSHKIGMSFFTYLTPEFLITCLSPPPARSFQPWQEGDPWKRKAA